MNGYPEDASNVGDAMRKELESLRADFQAFTEKHKEGAGDVVSKAGEAVKDWAGEAKKKAANVHDKLCEVAAERPLTTIACALVVGMIVGKMVGWSMSRK